MKKNFSLFLVMCLLLSMAACKNQFVGPTANMESADDSQEPSQKIAASTGSAFDSIIDSADNSQINSVQSMSSLSSVSGIGEINSVQSMSSLSSVSGIGKINSKQNISSVPSADNSSQVNGGQPINSGVRDLYVSPMGKDSNPGTQSKPFATIAAANNAVKNLRSNMKGDIVIHVASGYYRISSPIVIGVDGGGANGYKVIYRGDGNDLPVIGGGVQVTGWTKVDSNVWSAAVNVDDTRTFYVNDNLAVRARSKYLYVGTEHYNPVMGTGGFYKDKLIGADGMVLNNPYFPKNLTNKSDIELVFDSEWTHHRYPVSDIQYSGSKTMLIMQQPNWSAHLKLYRGPHTHLPGLDKPFYIENARELLDEPGEFYFDKTAKRIYYYPFPNENMTTAECYVGKSEMLLKVRGNSVSDRISGLSFENIQFKYGAWNSLSDDGIMVGQADSLKKTVDAYSPDMIPGQVSVEYANNITFKNCRFACLGSTALRISNAVSGGLIDGNVFRDVSGVGVSVGHPDHKDEMPEGMARCANIDITNNVIRRIGAEIRSAPAIIMYYVNTVRAMHNDIADIPYTGISLGWGWGQVTNINGCINNTISHNKIKDACSPTRDGAHIYTLGPMKNTSIHDNWLVNSGDIRGGIYPDEGSRYLNIYNNVIEKVAKYWLFARPGVGITDITVYNNYTDTAEITQDKTNVKVTNTTVVTDDNWPAAAVAVKNNSGVKSAYKYLLQGVEKPAWRKNMIKDIPKSVVW